MARRSSVRYWDSRKAYCCWFKGKQYVLAEGPDDYPSGPTYNAALKKFGQLTVLCLESTPQDNCPVRWICEKFLQDIQNRLSPASIHKYTYFLESFADYVDPEGDVPVWHLTTDKAEEWLAAMKKGSKKGNGRHCRWSATTVNIGVKALRTLFRWAARKKLIGKDPIPDLKGGRARSRGREALLGRTPKERSANHARILKVSPKSFRPFIVCLEATGCRPGELVNAKASDFDESLGALVYHAEYTRNDDEFKHKTAGRGKDRMIFLTGEALEIVRDLVKKRPKGHLFQPSRKPSRGKGEGKWKAHTIYTYFDNISRALKMPNLTAYSYRHTFATSWLEQGKSIDILAELLGNTPETLRKHYSHLLSDTANLRRQLEGFKAGSTSAEGKHMCPKCGAKLSFACESSSEMKEAATA